jgi:hypothetical protein
MFHPDPAQIAEDPKAGAAPRTVRRPVGGVRVQPVVDVDGAQLSLKSRAQPGQNG